MTATFSKALIFILLLLLGSCSGESLPNDNIQADEATSIVDSAIAFHGGELYEKALISFHFRGRDYTARRNRGIFHYTSQFRDSTGVHVRQLNNDGFTAYLNGMPLDLSSKDSLAYAESLNSVIYFTLLPVFLNDGAVRRHLDGRDSIDGKVYHRLKVTFIAEGGGIDYHDQYYYWFDVNDYSMDYLAYSFSVNDGGTRFRKAASTRRVNGIIFTHWDNYEGPVPERLGEALDLYKKGNLKLLSTIQLSQLSVSIETPSP